MSKYNGFFKACAKAFVKRKLVKRKAADRTSEGTPTIDGTHAGKQGVAACHGIKKNE